MAGIGLNRPDTEGLRDAPPHGGREDLPAGDDDTRMNIISSGGEKVVRNQPQNARMRLYHVEPERERAVSVTAKQRDAARFRARDTPVNEAAGPDRLRAWAGQSKAMMARNFAGKTVIWWGAAADRSGTCDSTPRRVA
jgi:hypothetical protein